MPRASCDGAAAGSMTTWYVTYVHAEARGERRARHFSMAMCVRLCLCLCVYKHWQARQGEALTTNLVDRLPAPLGNLASTEP
jgi:hypothetical protein